MNGTSGLTRSLYMGPSFPGEALRVIPAFMASRDECVQLNGQIFTPSHKKKRTGDTPTPMNQDFEREYSYRLALSKPLLGKLAEMLGCQPVETICVCGTDKRKRLVVHLSKVPALLLCGERSVAGHKVPDSLKSAASYMAFFHKMTSFEVIPSGIYDIACRKQNVAACLDILVPFLGPIMAKLKHLLDRDEVKRTNFEPMTVALGEKDSPRALLCQKLQQEWGQWAKHYSATLEQHLMQDITAVPQGDDHVPYIRKTDEEINIAREQSRLNGEKNNEVRKRRVPIGNSPKGLPSLFSKQPPLMPVSQVPEYAYGYPYPYEPGPSHLYSSYPTDPLPPPPPPPPPPSYKRPSLPEAPPKSFFPAPPCRPSLLPTPGIPPRPTLDCQRRAERVHEEIQYLVGLFEQKFVNPDGTHLAIMDSPLVQRALNLDYTSLQDAEHILNALKKTWEEMSQNNSFPPHPAEPAARSNVVHLNGVAYHRFRPGESVEPEQLVVWCRPGSHNRLVKVVYVKHHKAVIDFDDDIEAVLLTDLFLPGF